MRACNQKVLVNIALRLRRFAREGVRGSFAEVRVPTKVFGEDKGEDEMYVGSISGGSSSVTKNSVSTCRRKRGWETVRSIDSLAIGFDSSPELGVEC